MSDAAGGGPQAPQTESADLRRVWVVAILSFVFVGVVAIVAWAGGAPVGAHEPVEVPTRTALVPAEPGSLSVDPPPFQSDEALDSLEETGKPCSGCHDNVDLESNPERRELDTHDDIALKHDEEHRWCLDCHDAAEPRQAPPRQR